MTGARDLTTVAADAAMANPMPARQSDNLLAQVIAAAKDPTVDAEKMRTLADLVNGQQDRELKAEFNRDLNAAMMEMPVISKDGRIVIEKDGRVIQSTAFAKYEDIDRVCRPILRRHNLAIRFDIGAREGGGVTATPIISHTNGWVHTGLPLAAPIENSGSKNNVQGVGSSITYLKRYAYCAALNIVTEGADDDGNLGRGKVVSLPHEREGLVMREAEAAFEAGRYADHFSQLGPRDRAWLISSGNHERFGGQVLLPSASNANQSQVTQELKRDPDPPAKPKAQTPRQWVDSLKADVLACAKPDDLDLYMEDARDSLDRLKIKNEHLWEECQAAYRERRQALEAGTLV